MKTREQILKEKKEKEEAGENYYKNLKLKHCITNPRLSGFMSEYAITTEVRIEYQRRLIQMALVTFEIIGAGNPNDRDYVKVSQDSIDLAIKSKIRLEPSIFNNIDPDIVKAIAEANACIAELNNGLNEAYQTHIDSSVIWEKMQVLLKAYYNERLERLNLPPLG